MGGAKLPIITTDRILNWGPREKAAPFIPNEWRGTALDVLNCRPPEFEGLKRYDWLMWIVLRNECYPNDEFAWRFLRLFACDCAERALKKYCGNDVDERSCIAIEAARQFVKEEVTIKELGAVYSDAKAAYVTAREVVDAHASDTAAEAALRASYAGIGEDDYITYASIYSDVDPADYTANDANAATRSAVRVYCGIDEVDNAVTEAETVARTHTRAYAAEAACAAANAVADAPAAVRAAACAARADFHTSVYTAARAFAKGAADDAVEKAIDATYVSVLASEDPLRTADTTDNATILVTAEDTYIAAFSHAYTRIRAVLDAEERRWQVSHLKEMLECEITGKERHIVGSIR